MMKTLLSLLLLAGGLAAGLAVAPAVRTGERAAPPAPLPARPLDPPRTNNVAILVFEGVQIIDYSGPYEVFGQGHFRTFTVAAGTGPIKTSQGQQIIPTYTLADAPPFDVLVIPGGAVKSQVENPAVISWIREREPAAQRLLSVCNGAFILAKTGLLDGLSATTYYGMISDLKRAAPKTHVVSDKRFVDNGKIITTAGLSSGIDGALHVIEGMLGKAQAQKVALNMEYDWRPDSGFARAALADGPLRKLLGRELGLHFEGSGEARLLSTEGTAERWEARWEGKAGTSPAILQSALDHYLEEAGRWTPRGPSTGTQREWKFQDDDQKPWNATVDLQPGEAGSYRLAIRLQRLNG